MVEKDAEAPAGRFQVKTTTDRQEVADERLPVRSRSARRGGARQTAWSFPALLAFAGFAALAQSPESDRPEGAPAVPEPPDGYLVPDARRSLLDAIGFETPGFSVTLGLAMLVDYSWFEQDEASIAQVGVQEDGSEVRDARLTARGDAAAWRYQVTAQYKGFDREPTDEGNWTFTDVSLSRDLAFGTLSIGKLKQTFSYEMVGDAANLPQSERLLTPFFRSRDIGVRLGNTVRDQRGTWALGLYGDEGTQATARLTALPVWGDEGRRYLHVALAFRYNGSDDGYLRFSGRPESNVTDLYVDTGDLAADHAWHTGLEALWADRRYSILAEAVQARVSEESLGDPTFTGWYVTASWMVTGDAVRPYDRRVAYARRVPVQSRRGEIELVGRFGRVDLDDGLVSGGTLDKWYVGANWWATTRWKASLGYGDAELDRFGTKGSTKMLLARLQWIH